MPIVVYLDIEMIDKESEMKRTLLERKETEDREGFISLYLLHQESSKYATWRSNKETPDNTYWGHYFSSLNDAIKDYNKRS